MLSYCVDRVSSNSYSDIIISNSFVALLKKVVIRSLMPWGMVISHDKLYNTKMLMLL